MGVVLAAGIFLLDINPVMSILKEWKPDVHVHKNALYDSIDALYDIFGVQTIVSLKQHMAFE